MKRTTPEHNDNDITIWGDPQDRFNSVYGYVLYADWCRLEAARLGGVVREVDGYICVSKP